jgi:hypothetical protein
MNQNDLFKNSFYLIDEEAHPLLFEMDLENPQEHLPHDEIMMFLQAGSYWFINKSIRHHSCRSKTSKMPLNKLENFHKEYTEGTHSYM